MEQNLKHCCVSLDIFISKNNNMKTKKCPIIEEKQNENKSMPQNVKLDKLNEVTPAKRDAHDLCEKSQSLTPCYVKLQNLNIPHNKFVKSNLHVENVKHVRSDVPTEPITPKAQVEFSLELKKAINERNILTSKTRKRVFEALDEIKNKTEEERRNFKKEQALLEIVNSEIKYVHQLEIIINFFMKPTRERNLLKSNDYDLLFRNISTIYSINKELLDELDKGIENIAKAFSKIAPFFKLYSVYASEFKNTLKILQNARLLNPQFASFMENQESRPEVQNKLSALLITPIQRIPRYKLLLTNLYNLTKPSEEGFDILSDCLDKIENAAEHINKVVEDQENTQRLLEFQRCLRGEPNVITPGRKLIKEGILTKMSTKNAHSEKLYVALMNDILMFTRMKKDGPKVNSLKCLSIFPLTKCKVVEVLDKGCLKVICQEEELILYHDEFSETKNWIKTIKDTINEHMNDRKTLRKESSARRPVKRKDLHEYHEVGLSPGRPLKKRRFEMDTENVGLGSSNKILKRRPICASSEKISEKNVPPSLVASGVTAHDIKNTVPENNQKGSELSKDLYVFGKRNENKGFGFGKFMGDVGSTIKRFLGFRN